MSLKLIDPTFVFARSKGEVEHELVNICSMDTRETSLQEAQDAFVKVKCAAESGSPFAMCICARLCHTGWGTVASEANAFDWAKQASDSGFAPGHYELGRCYEAGIGVDKSAEEACRLYTISSDAGFGFAALQLAVMYHSAQLGIPDNSLALKWAMRAYELNEPMAPLELGRWFEQGEGVTQNESVALMWYERASSMGNFVASSRLSLAYAFGGLGLGRDIELAEQYDTLSLSQTQTVPDVN